MRKSKNFRAKQIKEKEMLQDYIKNHGMNMTVAILDMAVKQNLLTQELKLPNKEDAKEQLGLFLTTVFEDVHRQIKDGNGKNEFVVAMIGIAKHYDLVDIISQLKIEEPVEKAQ